RTAPRWTRSPASSRTCASSRRLRGSPRTTSATPMRAGPRPKASDTHSPAEPSATASGLTVVPPSAWVPIESAAGSASGFAACSTPRRRKHDRGATTWTDSGGRFPNFPIRARAQEKLQTEVSIPSFCPRGNGPMTGESSVATSATDRRQQLATRWCACGRQASKSSGYRFCWDCDPSVSAENKALARQLGGRRGAMTPSEVVRLLEGADLDTREGRQQLRDRFLRLRMAGRIRTGVDRDLLA